VTERGELLAALEAAAAELPDATAATDADGSTAWTRAGVRFAILQGTSVDLRVGALIGEAAVRTPDTLASGRGSDWVSFAPSELDDHARDRLGAWFAAAARRTQQGA
jgi:hypothetical protein